MNITEISKMKNLFEEFMKVYTQNPRAIILYGAGQGADWIINLLRTKDIDPTAIVDRVPGGGKKQYINYII